MSNMHYCPSILLFILVFSYVLKFCDAIDSISTAGISRSDTLISAGNTFQLGFLTTQSNQQSKKYLGIWYYELVPKTVVWVANRSTPLSDSCDVFGVSDDGNLNVWCSNGTFAVSITSVRKSRPFNTTLQLSDSGNLKLFEGQKGSVLWQSFDHPTDTFLPGMKMDDSKFLTSWIDQNDPGTGNFTFKYDQGVYIINKRSSVYWKSRETGVLGSIFNNLPSSVADILSEFDQEDHQSLAVENNRYISFPNVTRASRHNNARILLNYSGEIQYYSLYNNNNSQSWSLQWSEPPQGSCSLYDACGKFAFCHIKDNESMCRCLPGFKSASPSEDWMVGQYSDGCDRDSTLCSNNVTYSDEFKNILLTKVGGQVQTFDQALDEKACKEECLNNCKCEAYSFRVNNDPERLTRNNAAKCWILMSELVNLQQGYSNHPFHLVLRVPSLPKASATTNSIGNSRSNTKTRNMILLAVLVAGVTLVFGSCYILYRRKRRSDNGTRNHESNPVLFSYETERQVNELMDENDNKGIDVPFYNLDTILLATENFSNAKKLGQGGFGPVYKGKFPGGREIAVKRLSSCSNQGIEEFRNEVMLIAKLQHRNLVRLLGYCILENEKILLYEYMPNRSLDAFIFVDICLRNMRWTGRFRPNLMYSALEL